MKERRRAFITTCYSIWLVAAVLLLSKPAFVAAQQDTKYQWGETAKSLTIFQPGDAVRIQIFELYERGARDLNLSGDYPINPNGSIVMPIIGEVKVKGYTVYEVMNQLRERFSEFIKNPYVYVRPLIRLTMQGAFNEPSAYHVDPSSTVWDVVKQAGGPAGNADLSKMRVERGGKVVIPDVIKAFERGVSLEEVGIQSGDQLVVPTRSRISLTFLVTIINLFTTTVLLYLRIKTGVW